MKFIFVDFEMNPMDKKFKEERQICSKEIIEIGAVMLNDSLEEIDSFKAVIKPEYNSLIYKNYENLTGITNSMVVGAEKFTQVYRKFIDWCGTGEYETYAWSDSDRFQVKKEMKLKHFDKDERVEYMFEHWIDFQKKFSEIISSDRPFSLEKALNACGIAFSGKTHDALFDARNTSLLYVESKRYDLAERISEITAFLNDKEEKTTLGICLILGISCFSVHKAETGFFHE